MQKTNSKEYIRPYEIETIYGISKVTLYRWAKDENFPEMIKPSKRVTLINKKEFETYLKAKGK